MHIVDISDNRLNRNHRHVAVLIIYGLRHEKFCGLDPTCLACKIKSLLHDKPILGNFRRGIVFYTMCTMRLDGMV